MLICKAFRFRLYPNQAQRQALAAQFGHARFVYNHFLRTRREHYATHREGLRYHDTALLLTVLKRDPEHVWLREGDSQVLQQKLKDLERAFVNFFEGRARHPRFKSRRAEQSLRYEQRVKVELASRRTFLPKVGWGQFVGMLAYKGTWYGCDLVTADRWYPSSKTCSACGSEGSIMPLHVRTWECPLCGVPHDRDVNAAVNPLKQATVGTTGSHADGVHVRPGRQYNQTGTKKSEAPQQAAG